MELEASGRLGDQNQTCRKISRKELYDVLKSENFYHLSSIKCNKRLLKYVKDKLFKGKSSVPNVKHASNVLKVFISQLLGKWRLANYTESRFIKHNQDWLNNDLVLFKDLQESSKVGRPNKTFDESCRRSQQKQLKAVVSTMSESQLCSATKSKLHQAGKRNVAQLVDLITTSTPKKLKEIKDATSPSDSSVIKPYICEEALALIVDLQLTKEDYMQLRDGAKKRGADIYPPYYRIVETKKQCYPVNVAVSEMECAVPLQDLLDKTIERLVVVQKEVLAQNLLGQRCELEVFYKWGLDGSGGHSIYKQNFSNNSVYADSNIILCTIVPLEMSVKDGDNKRIFWKNMCSSSTRHCRPISFKLKKENVENTKEEYNSIQSQIDSLQSTQIILENKELVIKHIPICTMLDGKTVNILTETSSSQACNVCKVTPKLMNDLQHLKTRQCNTNTYKYGIPVLHAYLRCFEYLLNISYKLEMQKWQARGEEAQNQVKIRKKKITEQFYEKMGLVVDQPTQGGGNSNNGNTAKKFFSNPSVASEITGINQDLIERFGNILSVLSCGHYVNEEMFKDYCNSTAELCVSLYGWYKISASVHKLLQHGSDIIQSLPLPVGLLSEDVIEAGHKEYKHLRQYRSRKTSRVNTNQDIFNWMIVNSDPIITNLRKPAKHSKKTYNPVVLSMLRLPLFSPSEDLPNDLIISDDDDEVFSSDNDSE